MKVAILLGACVLGAFAEDARLTGPVPGFVFERSSQSIRAILGVVGSSHLGPAVAGGFDAASLSPLRESALARQAGGLYLLRNLNSSQPDSTPLDIAVSGESRFAWGQDGLSAAIYSGDSQRAQVVRNLDAKTPTVEEAVDLSSIEGAVSAMAFDGKRLLIAASGGVYLADGQSAPRLLARAATAVALSLDTARGDLYIASRDNNQIWMVRDYAGTAIPMLFADERAGVSSPAGIRVSGGRLLIANAGSKSIESLDIATRASLGHLDLDFAPDRMEALGTGQFSLLNFGGPDSPLYLLDSGGDLAVYFVPAGGDQ